MSKDYENKRSQFAERLKNTVPQQPLQQVQPIEAPPKIEEQQMTVWLPKALYKQVKAKAVEEELPLKEMVRMALENFLAAANA